MKWPSRPSRVSEEPRVETSGAVMQEDLSVGEQIVSLLRGPHAVVWDLEGTEILAHPTGAPSRAGGQQGWDGVAAQLHQHRDVVAIRDARGALVAVARHAAA